MASSTDLQDGEVLEVPEKLELMFPALQHTDAALDFLVKSQNDFCTLLLLPQKAITKKQFIYLINKYS